MSQPPLQVDALQIVGDPLPSGSRLIEADTTDGSLKLTDNKVPSGINLHLIPGLQQVDKVYLVGLGGLGVSKDSSGTSYNTIQDVLNDLSTGLTKDDPALILVAPGVYTENLTIDKDGIEIRGLGRVVIKNSGDSSTVTITSGTGTPLGTILRDLRIENDQDGRACVLVDGGIGSTVASESVDIVNCDLVATGVGGFQVDADTVNHVKVRGGDFSESASTCMIRAQQCASLDVDGPRATRFLLSYDSAGDVPSVVGSSYTIKGVRSSETFTCDLDGAGSLEVVGSLLGNTTLNGDRTARFVGCDIGNLVLNDTVAVTFVDGSYGTLSGAVGSSMAEKEIEGSLGFASSASETLTFDAPQPDVSYTVTLESDLAPSSFDDIPTVVNKTTSSFDVEFGAAKTATVRVIVHRTL